MIKGWKSYKLADLVQDIAMGPFGSNLKVDNFIEEGVPVIRGRNLNQGGFNDSSFVFVSEEKARSLHRSLAYPDDLIFTHRGTLGQVGIIPRGKFPYYVVSQSQMRLKVNPRFLNPKFLYYFFLTPFGQNELLKNSSQVGVPAIANPTKSLKDVNIKIPNVETQSRVAAFLSSFDDKIELNLKMNKTLEAITQAMYKEWFGGKESKRLSDYVQFNPQLSIRSNSILKYVEMADLNNEGPTIKSFIERAFVSGSKFQQNDTLLARITPCLENGKTGLVDFLTNAEVAFGSTEFIVMRPEPGISPYYVYLLARDNIFRSYAIKSMIGTSGRQRVQTDMLKSFLVPAIDITKMNRFHNLVNPLFEKIRINTEENKTLTDIRNSLLTKLITGKISLDKL